jgi:phage regulator Rha-like protein
MTNEVEIYNREPRCGTFSVSEGFNREHFRVIELVKKYEERFLRLDNNHRSTGFIIRRVPAIKAGRPTEEIMLNESQFLFLGTLFRNTEKVLDFKEKLSGDFCRMRQELIRLAAQNQNAEWLETRKAGKETRLIATDTIKTFVEYAKGQGSTKAEMYYANISKMENKALFMLDQKYPNLRNVLNIHQLSTIKAADMIVMKALADGMAKELHYRDIYQLAKTRIESFAEIIGKTLIPQDQLVDRNLLA